MKHKVGDKVRIKSREWYDKNKGDDGDVDIPCGFTKDMSDLCGKEAVITLVYKRFYVINIDNGEFRWSDEMFDDSFSYNHEKSIITEELIKDIANVIKSHNLGVCVSENGGKLIIEPLKVDEDLPIDTPCMVSDDGKDWSLRYYCGNQKCFSYACKSNSHKHDDYDDWLYIIEFNKFSPNNIEESLKYNIVK